MACNHFSGFLEDGLIKYTYSENYTYSFSFLLSQGDVIVSFDGVHVGCEGTVPFRSTERIAFRYLISQK